MHSDEERKRADEITGLSAFDDLEPVSVVSEFYDEHASRLDPTHRQPGYQGARLPPADPPPGDAGFGDDERTRMFNPDHLQQSSLHPGVSHAVPDLSPLLEDDEEEAAPAMYDHSSVAGMELEEPEQFRASRARRTAFDGDPARQPIPGGNPSPFAAPPPRSTMQGGVASWGAPQTVQASLDPSSAGAARSVPMSYEQAGYAEVAPASPGEFRGVATVRARRDTGRGSATPGYRYVPPSGWGHQGQNQSGTFETSSESSALVPLHDAGQVYGADEGSYRTDSSLMEGRPVGFSRLVTGVGLLVIVGAAAFAVWRLVAPAPGVATLVTEPVGAEVTVDGKPVAAQQSPYILELSPDEQHEVVISADGYESRTLPLNLGPGMQLALPTVVLKSDNTKTGFALDSDPKGARVLLDGAETGEITPAHLTGVEPGMHTVRLVGPNGYKPFELMLFVSKDEFVELPAQQLVPAGGRAGRAARAARAAAAGVTGGGASRNSTPSASATGTAPATGRQPGATGMLRLNSRPWAQVSIDGQPVGSTPLLNQQVAAGTHTIHLVNPDLELTKTIRVRVPPGQTVTKILNLAE